MIIELYTLFSLIESKKITDTITDKTEELKIQIMICIMLILFIITSPTLYNIGYQ